MNHFPKAKHWTTLLLVMVGLYAYPHQQSFDHLLTTKTLHDVTISNNPPSHISPFSGFEQQAFEARLPSFTPFDEAVSTIPTKETDTETPEESRMCPELTFEFNVPNPICRNTENDSVFLEVTVRGGLGTGTGTWFGPGIIDPVNGIFSPLFVNAGTTTISYFYTEDDCEYTATVDLEVASTALIGFNVDNNVNCQLDTVTAFLTAPLPADVNPVWELDGGQIVGGDIRDTIQVTWDTPGDKWIQLQAEQNGCESNPFPIPVRLDAPIDTPIVACDPTNERVDFSWDQVDNAQAFILFVVEGPMGFITSDTSYRIDQLQPGQTVIVRLATISQNSCPGNVRDFGCESLLCPIIELDIDSIPPICILNNQPQTIDLGLNLVDDSPGGGIVSWHGAGITDTLVGQITVDPSMVGQENKVYVNYTNAFCTYEDSTTFQVLTESEASFAMPTSFCLGDTASVFFTGSATANAELRWDFGGGTIVAGEGLDSDPYLITWPTEGRFTTQLELMDPGCGNGFSSQDINIAAPLPDAVVQCDPGLDSILFTWVPVNGASGFEVNVLEGPMGELIAEGSYVVRNLAPSTPVTIEVVYSSADCDGSRTTLSCSSLDCPAVNISILPIIDQCFVANEVDTIPLNINVDVPGGDLVMSGAGIYDPAISAVRITEDLIGQQDLVFATYSFGICEYVDSITFEVFQTPTASFDIANSTCVDERVTITFTGAAPADATLVWDFGDATILNNNNDRSIELLWDSGGDKDVSLFVASNGCFSETITQSIMISNPVAPPDISCTAGLDGVVFEWAALAGLETGQVTVVNGPMGTMPTNTSYEITGLAPNDTIDISVLFPSTLNCPDTIVTASCSTMGCPNSGISIDPVLPICFLGPGTLNLTFTPDPSLSGGVPNWRGPGVIDALNGLWQLNEDAIGRDNQIILDYSTGLCSYSDTIQIEVKQGPVASFDLPAQLCPNESAQVTFTGTASPTAVFDWDFGSGTAIPGTGIGPHEISWDTGGTFEVSLSISDNGCASGTHRASTVVLAPFSTPTVMCQPALTSLTFSWDPVAGASDYEVAVTPSGLAGTFTGPTSYELTDVPPGTAVDFQVTAVDPVGCRSVTVEESCSTFECPMVDVSWAGPVAICEGSQAVLTFSIVSPTIEAVDIQVSYGATILDLPAVRNGDELPLDISANTTVSITQITIPGMPVCSPSIPAPITIEVNSILSAGQGTDPAALCSSENQVFDLSSLLTGADAGGTWQEVSTSPSVGGAFDVTAARFTINHELDGTYNFQYIVAGGAPCPSDTSQLSITVNPAPTADAGPDIFLDCLSNQATLGGGETSAGMTYAWERTGTLVSDASTVDVETAGNYALRVTDPTNGCTAEDFVEVSAYDDFFVPFVSVSSITCFGDNDGFISIDSIVGTAVNVQSAINGGAFSTAKSYGPLGPGVYEIAFIDGQGCQQALEYILDEPNPINVELQAQIEEGEKTINLGDSVVLDALLNVTQDAVTSIKWTPDLPGSEGSFSLLVKPDFSTSYSVTVVDENGCESTDRLDLLVNRQLNVFMANIFRPTGENNSIFMVQGGSQINSVLRFLIFDRWGNKLFENANFPPNDPTYGWDGTFNNQLLNSGVYVYWLDLEMNDGQIVTVKGDVALMR